MNLNRISKVGFALRSYFTSKQASIGSNDARLKGHNQGERKTLRNPFLRWCLYLGMKALWRQRGCDITRQLFCQTCN